MIHNRTVLSVLSSFLFPAIVYHFEIYQLQSNSVSFLYLPFQSMYVRLWIVNVPILIEPLACGRSISIYC